MTSTLPIAQCKCPCGKARDHEPLINNCWTCRDCKRLHWVQVRVPRGERWVD